MIAVGDSVRPSGSDDVLFARFWVPPASYRLRLSEKALLSRGVHLCDGCGCDRCRCLVVLLAYHILQIRHIPTLPVNSRGSLPAEEYEIEPSLASHVVDETVMLVMLVAFA